MRWPCVDCDERTCADCDASILTGGRYTITRDMVHISRGTKKESTERYYPSVIDVRVHK